MAELQRKEVFQVLVKGAGGTNTSQGRSNTGRIRRSGRKADKRYKSCGLVHPVPAEIHNWLCIDLELMKMSIFTFPNITSSLGVDATHGVLP